MNIASGFICAALIVFAGIVCNGSDLERWLRTVLPLPSWPILPLASFGSAGVLLIAPVLKRRRNKEVNTDKRRCHIPGMSQGFFKTDRNYLA